MSVRQDLHDLLDELDDDDAEEVLDYVRWLLADEDALMPEELARAREGAERIARGEYVTLEELKRDLGF